MGGSALLQQQLALTGAENLLAPIGVQNLVTLAAMSQPAAAATAPLCIPNLLGKAGTTVDRTALTAASLQPAALTTTPAADLSTAYGSLITSATINAAAMSAAGKQIEGKSNILNTPTNIFIAQNPTDLLLIHSIQLFKFKNVFLSTLNAYNFYFYYNHPIL